MAWTFTVVPVYLVWTIARDGGPWVAPTAIVSIEYALPAVVAARDLLRRARNPVTREEVSRTL
jgi:hypothetical protein